MEAIALFGLVGLGYVVTRLSGSSPQTMNENFQAAPAHGSAGTPQAMEGSAAPRGPPSDPLTGATKGASPVGSPSELDLSYRTLMSDGLPASEPAPGIQGTLMNQNPPRPQTVPMNPNLQPQPEPIDSATASVAMNPAGIEATPNQVGGEFVKSELTGQVIPTSDFTHNNMTPFFGGRVRQNMKDTANGSRLDSQTGAGSLQIEKKEIAPMFDNARAPFGNPFGMEDNTDFVQSRINDPRSRNGERPFEPVRVAPAIKEGFGSTGKGGFQQQEVNQYMHDNIRTVDDLRTKDNPKLTQAQPVVPGQHFIGGAAQDAGEVRKYRPDRFYIDESGERLFVTTGDLIKETTRPIQTMKQTSRTDTSTEYTGPAASQEQGESYVVGSQRTPMAQQYGGAGYRNADMTTYYTKNIDAPEADQGRAGIEIRPNERNATSERTMGLNLVPAESGQGTVHQEDPVRPTRRAETLGNIRQTGTPVGQAGGAPAITVWDPSDVARTTVKEGTVRWDRFGIASSADGPTRLKVQDPDDIARPTQKAQISAKSDQFGAPAAANQDFTSHDAAQNMRTNPNKEQIASGRDPLHGNGGSVAVFTGDIYQTSKKIDADSVNDRANAINRVTGIPTGAGDIGQVRQRVPLKMDVSRQRNQREIISAVESNPLMQSLQKNAEADEATQAEWLKGM